MKRGEESGQGRWEKIAESKQPAATDAARRRRRRHIIIVLFAIYIIHARG